PSPRRAPPKRWAKTLVFDGAAPPQAPADVNGAPSPRRRQVARTIRFGSAESEQPVPPPIAGRVADAIHLGPASDAFEADDVLGGDTKEAREGAAPIVLYPRYGLVSAVKDEPEVEVIGADMDGGGEGVLTTLRSCTPGALAALRVLRHRLDQHRGDGHLV